MKRRLLAALLALGVLAGCGDRRRRRHDRRQAGRGHRVLSAAVPQPAHRRRPVTVTNLTKPGAEPHDVELNPRQVGQISDAALVVYLNGFQPAVDEAVEQEAKDRAFDAGSVVELLPIAERPRRGAGRGARGGGRRQGPARLARPGAVRHDRRRSWASGWPACDPAHAADYRARAAAVHAELDTLNAEFATGLRDLRPPRDRDQPHRVQLPGPAVRPDRGRHHRRLPRGRAVPAAAGRGGRARRGPPAPPRSSSRRWSARRWPRPSPARSARGPRCWTRWRG